MKTVCNGGLLNRLWDEMNKRPAKRDSAVCELCGAKMRPDKVEMYAHLLSCHPAEFIESPAVRNAIYLLQQGIMRACENWARAVKGTK
ncbi:MAG: hypothetical protein WC329_04375 [Candidatus Omnitrophota bacterium]|jgi:hypothetical protein